MSVGTFLKEAAAVPALFDKTAEPGRVLILDGDGPAYVAAATVARLDTAIRRFQLSVLETMYMCGAESALVHFTASGGSKGNRYRMVGVKPYQGNRDNKEKPSLLEPLREAMSLEENMTPDMRCWLHTDIEADDAMMHDAYQFRERGVIVSDDKDLRCTPWLYYDKDTGTVRGAVTDGVGELWVKKTAGGTKLLGHGPVFFWAQLLMGDTADNVAGLVRDAANKQVGPVYTHKALAPLLQHGIDAVANAVIEKYAAVGQNPWPEAWCLHIQRSRGDTVMAYFNTIKWSQQNAAFLAWAYAQKGWYV